ncbi:unnamed protein product, partial [Mesorhabditis spiculigera]
MCCSLLRCFLGCSNCTSIISHSIIFFTLLVGLIVVNSIGAPCSCVLRDYPKELLSRNKGYQEMMHKLVGDPAQYNDRCTQWKLMASAQQKKDAADHLDPVTISRLSESDLLQTTATCLAANKWWVMVLLLGCLAVIILASSLSCIGLNRETQYGWQIPAIIITGMYFVASVYLLYSASSVTSDLGPYRWTSIATAYHPINYAIYLGLLVAFLIHTIQNRTHEYQVASQSEH